MPVLNPEVLTDVLTEYLMKDNDSRTLAKLMLSGREPLHAVINYFKKAKSVKIYGNCMVVSVVHGGLIRYHRISYRIKPFDKKFYEFSMINLIMKTIAPKLDEIIISGYRYPQDFKAIEYFLEHKIKIVEVRGDLPEKYQQLLESSDFIEKVTICLFREATAMNMIPDSCRELKFKIGFFYGEEMNEIMKRHKEWLKNIEKLEIESIITFWTEFSISTLIIFQSFNQFMFSLFM